jgi:outer membrane protein assembly factor BamE (lipoprotein component of BamABCDE complex)
LPLLLAPALLTGCVFAPRTGATAGRLFPFELAARVSEGMSKSEVLSLLGSPAVELVEDGTERWYYYSLVAEDGYDVFLFPLLKVKRAPARAEEAEITFRHGEVVRAQARAWNRRHEPRYPLRVETANARIDGMLASGNR